MIAGIIIAIAAIIILATSIKIVSQETVHIVEQFGKYIHTWEAGIHFKVPFIQRVAYIISLKEQTLDFPPQSVITKDNVSVMVDSVVFMKVFNPKDYAYGIDNAVRGLENLAATTLRNIIGDMELDSILSGRDKINTSMQKTLDEATDKWGIKVVRVEVKNIQPPDEIEEAMTKQMKAERDRRQTVTDATAHKEAVVARAEGDKQAKVLAAEAEKEAQIALAQGRAESIRLIYEAEAQGLEKLKTANVTPTVLQLKGLEALKDVSDGRATKIFMPTDISNIVSTLGVVGESLGIGDATPINKEPKPEKELAADPCIKPTTSDKTKKVSEASRKIQSEVENKWNGKTESYFADKVYQSESHTATHD